MYYSTTEYTNVRSVTETLATTTIDTTTKSMYLKQMKIAY